MKKSIKVTVVGGGTGAYTVLRGLKKLENADITAIVTSADSGGSTGILRDEFGVLPVGDFRQCLVALSEDSSENENILRRLFEFRFDKGGKGLEGHNFGNLFITALTEVVGNEEEALKKASQILNIRGKVYPVTFEKIQLLAEYSDGSIAYGESMIDDPKPSHDGSLRIKRLWTQPSAGVYEEAKKAILDSDLIIFGPGDLYTSTLANVVIDDFSGIICSSQAKILYIVNLMSKFGQTDGFTSSDYISEMEKFLKRKIDYILLNNQEIPDIHVEKYKEEKAHPVIDDLKNDVRVTRADLLSELAVAQPKSDRVKRSVLRHSSDKIALQIDKLLQKIYK